MIIWQRQSSLTWRFQFSRLAPPLIRLPGTFSPYSDGEKGTGRNADAYFATLAIGETIRHSVFLPVTIRGEMSGRTMRGSAVIGD